MDIEQAMQKPERGCVRCGSWCGVRGCRVCEKQETYCVTCSKELDPGYEKHALGGWLAVEKAP